MMGPSDRYPVTSSDRPSWGDSTEGRLSGVRVPRLALLIASVILVCTAFTAVGLAMAADKPSRLPDLDDLPADA